jgi:GNAT superfamily N-acetyltransferase
MIPRKPVLIGDKEKIIQHFKDDIVGRDRYLRFGYQCSNENSENYINDSFLAFGQYDMWFICEDDNKVIATCHASVEGDIGELGFTVSPDYRGEGIGQELFSRGATWLSATGVKTIYTQCLSENKVMQHIAKKNGMTVVTLDYSEKEATIKVTKSRLHSMYIDRVLDNIAFVDIASQEYQKFFKILF